MDLARGSGHRLPAMDRSLALLVVMLVLPGALSAADSGYLVGLGSWDITGPAADVNMMGYANPLQTAAGIHFRLKARSFIVAEPEGSRVVFVNLDACMASQIVTIKVLEKLKERYGDLYTEKNVAISGIHTHAGPGGYLQYVTYIVTSFGFVRQSFDVIVDGIVSSITQAHENLRPGKIFVNKGELLDAGVNRSPSAYLNNPSEERAKYKYNVDTDMTLLKFVDNELGPVGSFNWFPTHGTSMSRTNSLISGDNKGAAARFMENWADQNGLPKRTSNDVFEGRRYGYGFLRRVPSLIPRPYRGDEELIELASIIEATGGQRVDMSSGEFQRIRNSQSGKRSFVSAFCQSNTGDVSPNTLGAFCRDTNKRCDFNHSTCNGRSEDCYGRGPGSDEFESTRIIGEKQYQKALELFKSASEEVKGKVDFRHVYLDFSKLEVSVPSSNGSRQVFKTCPAALGFGFAAGTTDGPGAFDFKQGDDQGNPFWRLVRNMLKAPGKEQVACHKPKPILLDTGEMNMPYSWAPSVLPIQILRVGQLIILSVPGEFTTMSGRRLRDAVQAVLAADKSGQFDNIHVVIAGLTNAYSQYVATFEEYAVQRYEGGSTLFGPHTLSAYIQEFEKLAAAMVSGRAVSQDTHPPDLLSKQMGLLPPVMFDSTPIKVNFGDCSADVPKNSTFKKGDTVSATFWSACPRNDVLTNGSFAVVETLDGSNTWVPAYDDDDWCLKFKWWRPSKLSSHSYATLEWQIPQGAAAGVYRLRHSGARKHLFGSISHFTGASRAFAVV